MGYDSASAFIEMFQKMLGTTPQMYSRSRQEPVLKYFWESCSLVFDLLGMVSVRRRHCPFEG